MSPFDFFLWSTRPIVSQLSLAQARCVELPIISDVMCYDACIVVPYRLLRTYDVCSFMCQCVCVNGARFIWRVCIVTRNYRWMRFGMLMLTHVAAMCHGDENHMSVVMNNQFRSASEFVLRVFLFVVLWSQNCFFIKTKHAFVISCCLLISPIVSELRQEKNGGKRRTKEKNWEIRRTKETQKSFVVLMNTNLRAQHHKTKYDRPTTIVFVWANV